MADVTPNISAVSKTVTAFARDAAYVAVGLGVMGFQRAQVRRVDLQRRVNHDLALDRRVDELKDGAVKGRAVVDDLAGSARQLVGSTLHPLEAKVQETVPAAVTTVTAVVRDQARGVRIHIRRTRR